MTNTIVDVQLLNDKGQVVENVSPKTSALAVSMENGNTVEYEINQLKQTGLVNVINDNTTAPTSVYSSSKINSIINEISSSLDNKASAIHSHNFESIGDIDFTDKTDGNVLSFENGQFALRPPSASTSVGDVNLKEYGISGSGITTVGSIDAGSKILTVSSTNSFSVGQDVAITNAAKEKMLVFLKVTGSPSASGKLKLTSGTNTAEYNLEVKYQTFDLTFVGQAPNVTTQYGISLEYNTKYVNLLANESAATFATRLATDGYFTNYWPGWTLSNPSTGVLRFTSTTPGSRKWGTQVFANPSLGANFVGTFSQIVEGTGSIGYVKALIDNGSSLPGWSKNSIASDTLSFEYNTVGPQPDIIFDNGGTGVTLEIKTVKTGIGELISKITSINKQANNITIETSADYSVSNSYVRHDDTRGIQKAILDLFDTGGGKIYLPRGTYRITRLYLKDGVWIVGSGQTSTKLISHELVWSTLRAVGEGSWWQYGSKDQRNEYIEHWGFESLMVTTSTNDKASTLPFTKVALEMFLANAVLCRDLNITKHYMGVLEKCSWYTHFENILVQYCHHGWQAPYFEVSATPSNHYNCTVKDNSGLGIFMDSVDIFNFVGGAVERNAMGGVKIVGGQTRTVTFDTVNLEANGGIPLEIGEESGTAPQSISFRNCSFKNWDTTNKQAIGIKLNKVVGFELFAPKFFNYEVAFDTSSSSSSFTITHPTFDKCTNYYKFNGGALNSDPYLMIYGDWTGIIGQKNLGWEQITPTKKYLKLLEVNEMLEAYKNGTLGGNSGGTITFAQRGYINAVLDFGVTVNDKTVDNKTALSNAMDKATELRIPLYIPAGDYYYTPPLIMTSANFATTGDRNVMIYGAGGTATRLLPLNYNADALVIQTVPKGDDTVAGSGIAPSGFIKDICIEGTTSNATTNNVRGLLLRGMRQFEVKSVTVRRMPIGFDLIDNCYGTTYYNCRSQLCGLGLNLQHGSKSGSDLNFYGCWWGGNLSTISISGGGGGYHFIGGQITGGPARAADADDYGAVIVGKDYLTGDLGTTGNIIFDGIDFEGIRYMHVIRSYGETSITVRNSSFLQTDTSTAGKASAPLSIWKATGASQSKLSFNNNGVKGYWKALKLFDITGQGSLIDIHEELTKYENVYFNSASWTQWKDAPLLVQSQCNMGHAFWRQGFNSARWLHGGIMYRENGGKVEQSTDWGATWTGFSVTSLIINGGTPVTGTSSVLLPCYNLTQNIPNLTVPAGSTCDVDFTVNTASIADDVRVIIDNMPSGITWSSWVSDNGKVRLRLANLTTSAIVLPPTHNVRISITKYQTPQTPNQITYTVTEGGIVVLSWPPVIDATSYNVYQNGVKVASPTSSSVNVTGLTPGNSYTFEIGTVAYGDAESLRSSSVQLTAKIPTVYIKDTFTTDAASLGNSDNGVAWSGGMKKSNGTAYADSWTQAKINASSADFLMNCDVTRGSATSLAFGFRQSGNDDSNRWVFTLSGSNVTLAKRVNWTDSNVAVATKSFTVGEIANIKIRCKGSSIRCYYNDFLLFDVTDSSLNTLTYVGILPSNESVQRYDNFTVIEAI